MSCAWWTPTWPPTVASYRLRHRAFVSGYDFLADAAEAVQAELEAGIGQPADTLIAPRDQAPQDPLAWTGEQLEAQFLGSRHDLNFLAGHFSAATALGRRLHHPYDHGRRAVVHRGPGKCDHLQRWLPLRLQHRQRRCRAASHA